MAFAVTPFREQILGLQSGSAIPREAALDFILSKGFPNRREEDWKYTSLKDVLGKSYLPSLFTTPKVSDELKKFLKAQANANFYYLFLINGEYCDEISDRSKLPSGVRTLINMPEESFKDFSPDAFSQMNIAFTGHSLTLKVLANVTLEKPICIFNYVDVQGLPPLLVQPLVKIEVDENSKVQIVEEFSGTGSQTYFCNSALSIEIGAGAELEHLRIVAESSEAFHYAKARVNLAERSIYRQTSNFNSGAWGRYTLQVNHLHKQSSSEVSGTYLCQSGSQADYYSEIKHLVGECKSRQIFKGILTDNSRAVFSGKVIIAPNSQGAYSEQLNQNLLLSSDAEVFSKPQLEVNADDVKATHGSTVGHLDENEFFYLLSRGISKEKALALLCHAFVSEIIMNIQVDSMKVHAENKLKKVITDLKVEQLWAT